MAPFALLVCVLQKIVLHASCSRRVFAANPLRVDNVIAYLIRTLPEKLFNPDGTAAFGRWEGGLLGVLSKQMEDVSAAALRWNRGQ